jgi:hypothetical protein
MNEDKKSILAELWIQILYKAAYVSSIIGLFLLMPMVASAADRDIELTKSLIAAIKQSDAPERDRVEETLAQISTECPHRPVAAQAVAMIYIQQGRFAEARNCLKSSPALGGSMQLNEHRLKLWSLLEEESTDGTEGVFKDVVRSALSKSLENNEHTSLIEQLGTLVGMLQTEENPKAISIKTIEQAKNALETRVSKSHASRFLGEWEKSKQRGMAIKAKVAEFQSLDAEEAKRVVSALEAELEKKNSNVSSIKDRNEEERRIIDEMEVLRKKLFNENKNLNKQLKTETPGEPRPPVAPTEPREPNLKYVVDKATGQRVLDARSARELADFKRKTREYPTEVKNFKAEFQNYQARYAAWEVQDQQRRAAIKTQLQQIEGAISFKDKEIDVAKKKMREGAFAELKEAESQQSELSEVVLISQFALADKLDTSGKPKSSIRPSRFDLIDFTAEEARLLRALR